MRISDWSSDVCSSDLVGHVERAVDEDGDAVRLAPGLEVVELVGDRGAEHDRAMLVAVDHLAVEEGAGEEVERSREVRGETQFLRSEEHTSELKSLMRISYAVFCLKHKNQTHQL